MPCYYQVLELFIISETKPNVIVVRNHGCRIGAIEQTRFWSTNCSQTEEASMILACVSVNIVFTIFYSKRCNYSINRVNAIPVWIIRHVFAGVMKISV